MKLLALVPVAVGADLVPTDLLGPYALLIAALLAVGVLWRTHRESDMDMRRQRDLAIAISTSQVTATNRLADLLDQAIALLQKPRT